MSYNWTEHQVSWNIEKVTKAKETCSCLYEELLLELTEELNRYHSINWSSQQYRILIGNWLESFIFILYDRWLGSDSLSFVDSDPWVQPATSFSEIDQANSSDSFNYQLYLQLFHLKSGKQLADIGFPSQLQCSTGYSLEDGPRALVHLHGLYHTFGRWKLARRIYGNSIPHRLSGLATPLLIHKAPPTSVAVDAHWRRRVTDSSVTTFEEAASLLVRAHLPVPFLEAFKSMRESSSIGGPPFLFSSISIQHDIHFKFLAAETHGRTRLLIHQHGGDYGLDAQWTMELFDRSVADVFYTWGWIEDEKTRPLPVPPRLPPRGIFKTPNKVLLTCNNYPRYPYRADYIQMGSQNLTLIEQTIRFVRAIDDLDLEISYYPHDYGWNVQDRFSNAGVYAPTKSQRTENYKLHICNYVGTAWLETLTRDVPTICFYDPEVNLFREKAQAHIDLLTAVGVLHTSPESAAEKVREVHEDPLRWWQTSELQEIRQAFVRQYARLEEGWLDAWHEEFSRIAETTSD